MNARITKDGHLEIERAGEWKEQICPWVHLSANIAPSPGEDVSADLEPSLCGDWCPLFRAETIPQSSMRPMKSVVTISCSGCPSTHTLTTDARGKTDG